MILFGISWKVSRVNDCSVKAADEKANFTTLGTIEDGSTADLELINRGVQTGVYSLGYRPTLARTG